MAASSCDPPLQIVALAGVILPVGADATFIVEVFVAGPLHDPFVITTLYVPAAVALWVAAVAPPIAVPFKLH